jgi:hypothetical protein
MKIIKNTIFPLMVAILVVLIFSGCQEDPMGVADIDTSLPEITSITSGVDKMLAGGTTDVAVTAKQGSSYKWTADAGSFADASSASTTWNTEGIDASSAVKLKCTVTNGSGSSSASVTVQVVVSTTPTFHWPFDSDLTELIAGNNGSGAEVGINTTDARIGAGCAEFSGDRAEESVMTVADDASVQMGPESDYTFIFWMKTEDSNGGILARETSFDGWDWDGGKQLKYWDEDGETALKLMANSWSGSWAEDAPELWDNEWHLVAVAHFGDSDTYQFFVDGESAGGTGIDYDDTTADDEGTIFFAGGVWDDEDAWIETYTGLLDELKYYDVVVTEAEIALLSIVE